MKAPGSSNLTCLIFSPLEPHWGLSGYNIVQWENERKKWTLSITILHLDSQLFHDKVREWRIQILSWKESFLFSSHLKDAKTKNGDIFKPSWIYQDKPNFLQILCKTWGLWHTLTDTNLRPLAQILCKDWGLWHTLTDHSNNSSLQKELLDPWQWFSFQRDLPEGHVMEWKSFAAVSAMLAIPGNSCNSNSWKRTCESQVPQLQKKA